MQQQMKSADRLLIRNINQSILLNLIRAHGPISRPQLATLSGLSQVTVIKITNNLIDRHMILEKDYAESTGGRRAGLLEIHPEGGFVVGLIPHESSLIGVILNLNSELVYFQQWNIPLRDQYVHAIDLLAQCVEDMFSQSSIPREKIIGVGIGMSGLIDAEGGCCIDSWMMNWQNVEISRPLESAWESLSFLITMSIAWRFMRSSSARVSRIIISWWWRLDRASVLASWSMAISIAGRLEGQASLAIQR